jgi:transposase
MYYTGIDLHKKTSFITTVDEKGKVVNKANLKNVAIDILQYFDELLHETRVVIESMSSWYWLYDLLTEKGFDVVISNPVKTKAIASAKIKNDKVDSHMLAQLLRADLISRSHVSSMGTRKLKELLRHRQRLVRDTSRMKNRVHALLMKNNLQHPGSDLFGAHGLSFLHAADLPDYHREQLGSYLSLYECIKAEVDNLTKQVYALAKAHPIANLLMTIPGIGPIVAMVIVSEVEDITRFPSYRNLSSYAGLVPSLDASGSKERTGRITKQGSPYMRTALVESAQVIPRLKNCRLNVFFRRRIIRAGYAKAITATAHKILQIVYYVWRNHTPYREEYNICG